MTKELIELGLRLKKEIGTSNAEYYEDSEGKVSLEYFSEGEWVDEGKYAYCRNIYRVLVDGGVTDLYLSQTGSRSGSYFSEYYTEYDPVELCAKKEYTRVVVEFEPIKVM